MIEYCDDVTDVRVVVARMIEIVADGGGDEHAQILFRHHRVEPAQVDHAVHHLSDAETVTEIVERVVAVVFLHTQLKARRERY